MRSYEERAIPATGSRIKVVRVDRPSLEAELGIDPVALRARYRAERDKRLRPDALAQYVEMSGEHAHFLQDPHVEPGFSRPPLKDEIDVAVIGGGLSGICLGASLRKAGVRDVRIIERGGDFGGVWYWNRYPGAACDTQAMLYLPMLEELGRVPLRKFATGPEIREHLQTIARKFDLYRQACLQTEVQRLHWDEGSRRWIVSTDRGDELRARHVAVTLGPMERPKLPGIPGVGRFRGHSFHTSRWDYAYTGGGPDGDLTNLKDRVVGIIGTGATAVQCIPHLAAASKHLYVFQRTPSSIDVRDDQAFDPERLARLGPGWQLKVQENFTALTSGLPVEEDLIADGWTSIMGNIKDLAARKAARGEPLDNPMSLSPLADLMKMEQIRARVTEVVQDPATAALLTPWYDRFCKRPCFADDFLPTFNRANVTLVDTSAGQGVEEITETSIVVDGRPYAVDCLIYSTGFDVNSPPAKRLGYEVTGRAGQTLREKWADGAATQHGIATRGFPNLFLMSVAQSGFSLNFTHMIEQQAHHIAYVVGRAISEGIDVVEVSQDAEDAWCAEVDRAAIPQEDFLRECTPSYFNWEGDLKRRNIRNSPYGAGGLPFYRMLAEWRAEGGMNGLELAYCDSGARALSATPQVDAQRQSDSASETTCPFTSAGCSSSTDQQAG